MKKRSAIISVAIAAAVLTAAGCQKTVEQDTTGAPATEGAAAAETSASTGGKKTIRIGWWGNQTRNDATVAAIELYQSLNPEIHIEYEFSDWSGYWDKLSTQAAGGTLPDLIQHDYSRISQYVSSGQLLDLSPYAEAGTLDLSQVSESVLAGGTIDGKLYGVCLGTNAPIMAYDKEIAARAGVTVPMQPTFEELYEICGQIYQETGVKTFWDGGMVMMTMIARSEGKDITNCIETADQQLFQAHYEYLQKFSEAEWAVTADILAEKNPDVVETKPIVDQTTWNDFTFSNMFIGLSQTTGRELEMIMYPQKEDASNQCMYLKPSMFFTIAANSEYPDETVEFLNWFINDQECNKILLAERGIPISVEVASMMKEAVDETAVKVFDYIAAVEKIATLPDPPSPSGFSEIEAYNRTMVENIRYGEMNAAVAAADFAVQAKAMLEKAN